MPPGALPFVFLLLHAAAVAAVPAAGGPEPQFTRSPRLVLRLPLTDGRRPPARATA